MTPLKRIAGLSAAFLGSNLARAAIGFALSLALGRGLGVERFGRWVLCTTWASILTVAADLGFGVLLARDGARPDTDHGRLLGAALALRAAIVLPLGAILYAGATGLAADPESTAGLRAGVLLGVAGAAYGCFGAMFRSQPRWVPTILGIETAWLAVQLLASWWLVSLGAGVPALVWLATGVQLAQTASALLLWGIAFARGEPIRIPARATAIAVLRRALPFAASGIVANLQTRVGPLMLGFLSTQAELGSFAAASRFATMARLGPGAVFAGALPVFSSEYERNRHEAGGAYKTFDRALVTLTIAIAMPCILLAGPIIRLVYGSGFVTAAPALRWVGVALVPALANSGKKVFLYAAGAETIVVRWSAIGLGLQVFAGMLLVPVLGAVGAAISLAVGEAAVFTPLRRARPDVSEEIADCRLQIAD
jgi:O-antigen/teichoic acid export membrane protein